MDNLSSTSEFLLVKFSDVRELQLLYFSIFSALYLTSIAGNLLIITVIKLDHRLHIPMYFFIMNLAVLDIATISVTIPKSMSNFLMNIRSISYSGCVAQVFFFYFFSIANFGILIVMAKDRYVAICHPLHYETIMNKQACIKFTICAWIGGMLYSILHSGGTFANTFCSNTINQFFCQIPYLIKLACSDLYLIEIGFLALSCFAGLVFLIFIIVTYTLIFTAVFKLPSVQSQKKALSTCFPHMIVVSLLVLSAVIGHLKPPSNVASNLDLIMSMFYAVLSPMLNPFIYSMRNKDIKAAFWRLFDVKRSSETPSK